LVSEVVPGGPSEASEIMPGDIITKVNLKEVGTIQEFEEAFDAVKTGSSVHLTIFRDDKFREINLILKP
jgi:S1-C subfamily serine protease